MKHLTLLLLLLYPVLFYGQEEVTYEGFFINEKYLDENRFYMYALHEGRDIQLVSLNLLSEEMAENFKNIANTAYIKVKGESKWGINVTQIVAFDNNNLLLDYLKEKQPKTAKQKNEPYEGEGHLMQLPCVGLVYIPIEKDNVLGPLERAFMNVTLKGRDKILMQGIEERLYVSPPVEVKGMRSKGELYDEIRINDIFFQAPTVLEAENYFIYNDERKFIPKVEYFEEEGFYSRGFEQSEFRILRGDILHSYRGWVGFSEKLQEDRRYSFITRDPDRYMADKSRGVFLKVKGVKVYGHPYGYGHMGVSDYELYVTDIEAIDTKRTLWDFIESNWNKDGYYLYKGQKLTTNKCQLKENKLYTFTGAFNNRDKRNSNDFTIKLDIVRKGIYLEYHYRVYDAKGKIKKEQKGTNMLDFGMFQIDFERYEAKDKKHLLYDLSLFTIEIESDVAGELTAEVHDYEKKSPSASILKQVNP